MIFLNLPELYDFHKQLLARMQQLSKTSPWTMTTVFVDEADTMVMLYGHYCALHSKSLQALDRRMVRLVTACQGYRAVHYVHFSSHLVTFMSHLVTSLSPPVTSCHG